MTQNDTKTCVTWEWAANNGFVNCILDGCHGGYIPQMFINGFDGWTGISDEDRRILEAGPDHEHYWDAWDDVVADAKFTDSDGETWSLFVDGDLFAIADSVEIYWD